MSEPLVREKVIRWDDPLAMTAELRTMSGIDALNALMNGDVSKPPILNHFDFEFRLIEMGKVQLAVTFSESHYNLLGSVHGGAIATLLDTVMGCAVQSVMPLGRTYTTLNIGVNYLRAITVTTGEVIAEGTIIHAGRTTALAQGRILDAAGKIVATGETTCLLFDVPNKQG
ncbi:MAG: PaaI family thioesterase [Gemmatimonadaceae bacterium]